MPNDIPPGFPKAPSRVIRYFLAGPSSGCRAQACEPFFVHGTEGIKWPWLAPVPLMSRVYPLPMVRRNLLFAFNVNFQIQIKRLSSILWMVHRTPLSIR
jgi:hypothetical protein